MEYNSINIYGEYFICFKRKDVCRRVKLGNIKTNYDVTITGNVYNRNTELRLTPINVQGYYRVLIYYTDDYGNSIRKQISIHKLVANAFIPNPKHKSEVHHIDGDSTNNNVSNLMWVTNKEHNEIHQRMGKFQKSVRYGEDNNFTKTTTSTVLNICEEFKKNELTPPEIAKKYNVSRKMVTLVLYKKRWKHLTKNMDFSMYTKVRAVDAKSKKDAIDMITHTDLSLKEISKLTGVSHTYVSHINRELNLRKKNMVVKRSTTRERLSDDRTE